MMKAKIQGKICVFGVAEGSCLSLHARLHAMVAVSTSLEARLPSKGAMRWQVGNGQMPHLIYPQATETRPRTPWRVATGSVAGGPLAVAFSIAPGCMAIAASAMATHRASAQVTSL